MGNLERLHAQFRAEFFNILNHTNFASPVVPTNNTSLFAANGTTISSAGVLTSTTTTSRQIQFCSEVNLVDEAFVGLLQRTRVH
jgi:hypothetical protein